MMRYALVPAVMALAACENGFAFPDFRGANGGGAGPSEATQQFSDKERLTAAIASNGCEINPLNVGPILFEASVDDAQSEALLTELVAEGALTEGAPGTESLRLTTPACTQQPL